ncbi:melatonin receptor type 1B-B-like [Ptychodera flava]|uniref:melatonin receptor type 1B-B-like n=1 Tax=Ptychodera flava TaxID=63121 RepID=UPI00396A006C
MATNASANIDALVANPSFIIVYLLIQTLLMVFGTLGNILVLLAFVLTKKLRSVTNVFIFNLALSDLAVTAFILPFNVVGIVKTHRFFAVNSALCEVVAFVCVTSCVASLWNIMAISLNRYIHICRSTYYRSIFSRRNTIAMAVSIWLVSVLIDLPNFLNWGDNRYDMKTLVCSYDRSANYGWILLFISTAVVVPGVVVICCYVNIIAYVRSHSMRVNPQHHGQDPSRRLNSISRGFKPLKISRRQMQLLKMTFAIFTVFLLCWLPYGVVVLVDFEDRLSQTVHVVVWVIAHASTAVDSIIYGVTSKQFRDSYFDVFKIIRRQPRIQTDGQNVDGVSEAFRGSTRHPVALSIVSARLAAINNEQALLPQVHI